jgi:PII-like signaling protein
MIEHNAVLMRIYLSEGRRSHGEPLYRRLIEALLAAGFRGATAFHGIEGFGEHHRIASTRLIDAVGELPILIEVLDDAARIEAFLPTLETLLDDGLVTLERVERVTFKPHPASEGTA